MLDANKQSRDMWWVGSTSSWLANGQLFDRWWLIESISYDEIDELIKPSGKGGRRMRVRCIHISTSCSSLITYHHNHTSSSLSVGNEVPSILILLHLCSIFVILSQCCVNTIILSLPMPTILHKVNPFLTLPSIVCLPLHFFSIIIIIHCLAIHLSLFPLSLYD